MYMKSIFSLFVILFFLFYSSSLLFAKSFEETYLVEVGKINIGKLYWKIELNKDDYNVLIMTDGSFNQIDSSNVKSIKSWVKRGGCFISTGSGSKWIVDNNIISETVKESNKDTLDIAYENIQAKKGAQRIGGSIFQIILDNTHPIAFGYQSDLPIFRNNETFYELSTADAANVGRYSADPLISGYISDEMNEKIKSISENTFDISEYLVYLHKQGNLNTNFENEIGTVNYHVSCHLKAQQMGFKGRDILKLIPNTKVNLINRCSGMDGGWGMKTEYFEPSMKVAERCVNDINKRDADIVCSDCSLASHQLTQASEGDVAPSHPILELHKAYGFN